MKRTRLKGPAIVADRVPGSERGIVGSFPGCLSINNFWAKVIFIILHHLKFQNQSTIPQKSTAFKPQRNKFLFKAAIHLRLQVTHMQLFLCTIARNYKYPGKWQLRGWILLSHDRSKKQRSKLCFFFRKPQEATSQESFV